MADDRRYLPPARREEYLPPEREQPRPLQRYTPAPAPPSVPAYGDLFGINKRYAKRQADYIRAESDRVHALTGYTSAVAGLIEERIRAALILDRATQIPELIAHARLLGALDRRAELEVRATNYATEIELARARLLEARQHSTRFLPSAAALPAGRQSSEVDDAEAARAATFADIDGDATLTPEQKRQQKDFYDRHVAALFLRHREG